MVATMASGEYDPPATARARHRLPERLCQSTRAGRHRFRRHSAVVDIDGMTEAIVGSGADTIGVLFGDVWNGGDLDALDRVFTSDVRPMSYGGMTWCRLSDGLISDGWRPTWTRWSRR